jgi:hypothetical protein
MILSIEHRFLFVHVPKTAGTALAAALARYHEGPRRTLWRSLMRRLPVTEAPDRAYLRKHETAADIRAKLSPAVFDRFLRFACVRHPYDHAVSHYEFMKEFRIPLVARKVAAMSFADYLRYRMRPPFWNDTFFARLPDQAHFLIDGQGRLLVNRLLRYETLEADFARLAAELGLGDLTLPRVNETRARPAHRPVASYYDAEAKALADRLYARDFALFGYRPELPAA